MTRRKRTKTPTTPRLTDKKRRDLLDGFKTGQKLEELSLRFKISIADVRAILKEAGLPIPGGSKRTIPEDDLALTLAMVNAYRSGQTCPEIGEQFGFPRSTVYFFLVRSNVDRHPVGRRKRQLDRATMNQIVRTFQKSPTIGGTSQILGLPRHLVSKALRDRGVPIPGIGRGPKPIPPEVTKQIIRLRKAGVTITAISEEVGLSYAVVRRCLPKEMVSTKPGRPRKKP